MRHQMLAALLLSGSAVLHASTAQSQRTTDVAVTTPPSGVATSPVTARPGDIVRLRIWREPDMSGDFVVDALGRATLPRLGPIAVTDVTSDSLQRVLVAEYARFLRNPSVEVTLLQRVRVVGAVRTPGVYNVDPTMGLRDVLALAGGPATDGRTDEVRLDRDGHSTWLKLGDAPSTREMRPRSGDQLFLPQRSWLARNTPLVAAIASASGALLMALATR